MKGLGVESLSVLDPYDIPGMIKSIKEARADLEKDGQGAGRHRRATPLSSLVEDGEEGTRGTLRPHGNMHRVYEMCRFL